ncbi:methyl-accepting chemotaxis protein [Leptolyngbya sp. 15MV]|nr:methyl-accepting chemotaxis protein [Leptolyngbya sp. 15MV]
MKGLAADTRKATNEISRTIDTLGAEAQRVIEQIETGGKASSEAKASVTRIEDTINGVSELVEEVDRQNEQIARATGTISDHVHAVQDVLQSFDGVALENEGKLENAHRRMAALELTASDMFDDLVKAGLSPNDSMMVEKAQQIGQEIAAIAEAGIAQGAVTIDAFFDQDYRQVAGSNPPRFRTAMSDWADANWRPVLDRVVGEGGAVKMCSQADMNGFLPTHTSDRSRAPVGEITHDTMFCRNGRILLGPIDQKAKRSSEPYMMAVYRQEGDGQRYEVVRNVYVPLFIGGRRWGDFELAYTTEED